MKKLTTIVILLLPLLATAHHSFAPHFDRDKPVNIAGIITEFERRNPHAYLKIRAEDADGRVTEWRCETHGVTQLARNGISEELLSEGNRIGITGSQHRRDPTMCFFDIIYLEDGRELSVNGNRGNPDTQFEQRDSIFGNWMLLPSAGFTSSGPQFMMDFMTTAGEAAASQYNPLVDDPAYQCSPVAIRRAWAAPGTPLSISRQGEDILIKHEWMDIERVIHMNQDNVPEGTPDSVLGYSRGHFEDGVLVIETTHFSEGVINQYVTIEGRPLTGVMHSDELRTEEQVSFDADSNRLSMSLKHWDEKYFTRDFPVYSREYRPSDLAIQPFGCIPEVLN